MVSFDEQGENGRVEIRSIQMKLHEQKGGGCMKLNRKLIAGAASIATLVIPAIASAAVTIENVGGSLKPRLG